MPVDEIVTLANRCMLPGLPGPVLDDATRRWLDEGLGGLVLFAGNIVSPDQLAELTHAIHTGGTDVLIAADEEGGDVTRLHHTGGSTTPGNLALGAAGDLALTREVARTIGHDLRGAGIDWDLAPDVDVNTNPANPVIGTRSFGDDPDAVAAHGVAYLNGLRDAGILSCAKHFPGHGDTQVDSHFGLPHVEGDLEPHLVPFRAAIEAGVDSILTAHIVFPALDTYPATLSRRIVTDLLRGELGYDGLVLTDSMTMKAVADTYGLGEGAVLALMAGVDMICVNADVESQLAIRDALVTAAKSGRLPADRLAEAAGRVRALAGLARDATGALPVHGVEVGVRAAAAGLFVSGLTLPLATSPYVVEITGPRRGVDSEAGSLLTALRHSDPAADGVRLRGEAATERALRMGIATADGRPLLLVVRDALRSAEQTDAIRLVRSLRPDVILVGIGSTYDSELAGPGGYVGTRGAAAANLTAAAIALRG